MIEMPVIVTFTVRSNWSFAFAATKVNVVVVERGVGRDGPPTLGCLGFRAKTVEPWLTWRKVAPCTLHESVTVSPDRTALADAVKDWIERAPPPSPPSSSPPHAVIQPAISALHTIKLRCMKSSSLPNVHPVPTYGSVPSSQGTPPYPIPRGFGHPIVREGARKVLPPQVIADRLLRVMPKFTLDGRELEAAPGRTVIEAAADVGIEIPHYCWHPHLSIAANCRMCLVEIENAPKLMPACEVKVRDGMVVQSKSPKVLDAREAVMEFLLVNHPIDCPICDQAGECKLQDYYMAHDRSGTRFREVKVVKNKAVTLGPWVMLDEERCINCTRCVRFMDEVAKNPQLGQFDRGDRAVIGTFPGQPFDDPYSLNTVEICPVGALTSRDFRFKVRSWFLKSTESVCAGCARGCNIQIDHYNHEVQRYRGRDNRAVNKGWLCDEGRLSYKRIHDPETQLTVPHRREDDGRFVPISWDEAADRVRALLARHVGADESKLGMSVSPQCTNEGITALVELSESLLRADTFAILGRADWRSDEILRVADQNPNRAGAEQVFEAYSLFDEGPEALQRVLSTGRVETLLMLGTDHPTNDDAWLETVEASEVIAFTSNWDPTALRARIVLPMTSFAEQDGTWINVQGRLQRIQRAIRPINGRKSEVEAVHWIAQMVAPNAEWSLRNWLNAFNALKKRVPSLEPVKPLKLLPWGATLEEPSVDGAPRAVSTPA
ncbi:MAG: molybdopterin-dependent oxidoreductase [Myxococcales bacterium]|nr:molybdopterin-dependent oxidoreductase [Myxococcales bacterium]